MLETVLGVMEGRGMVENKWGFLNRGVWVRLHFLRVWTHETPSTVRESIYGP